MREINLTEVPRREIPMNADPETFIQPQPIVIAAAAVRLIAPSDRNKAPSRLGIAGLGYIDNLPNPRSRSGKLSPKPPAGLNPRRPER